MGEKREMQERRGGSCGKENANSWKLWRKEDWGRAHRRMTPHITITSYFATNRHIAASRRTSPATCSLQTDMRSRGLACPQTGPSHVHTHGMHMCTQHGQQVAAQRCLACCIACRRTSPHNAASLPNMHVNVHAHAHAACGTQVASHRCNATRTQSWEEDGTRMGEGIWRSMRRSNQNYVLHRRQISRQISPTFFFALKQPPYSNKKMLRTFVREFVEGPCGSPTETGKKIVLKNCRSTLSDNVVT